MSSRLPVSSITTQSGWVLPASIPAQIRVTSPTDRSMFDPADGLAGITQPSDLFAHPNQRPSRRGATVGQALSARGGSLITARPDTPGSQNLTTVPIDPEKSGSSSGRSCGRPRPGWGPSHAAQRVPAGPSARDPRRRATSSERRCASALKNGSPARRLRAIQGDKIDRRLAHRHRPRPVRRTHMEVSIRRSACVRYALT